MIVQEPPESGPVVAATGPTQAVAVTAAAVTVVEVIPLSAPVPPPPQDDFASTKLAVLDSGYTTAANSQLYPLQLQSLAEAAQSRAGALESVLPPTKQDNAESGSTSGGCKQHRDIRVTITPPNDDSLASLSQQQQQQQQPPCSAPQHETNATERDVRETARASDDAPVTPTLNHSTIPPVTATTSTTSTTTTPPIVAGAKRTSSGILKVGSASAPVSPRDLAMMSPPSTVVRRDVSAARVSPAGDPVRIQELSAQLRTRLKYARIKVDNNWTTKSLEQVETIYQNSPARLSKMVRREESYSDFGQPLQQARRPYQGPQMTSNEAAAQYQNHSEGARTYESFWREHAPYSQRAYGRPTGHPSEPQSNMQYTQNSYHRDPPTLQRGDSNGSAAIHSQHRRVSEQTPYTQHLRPPSPPRFRPPPALTPSNSNLSVHSNYSQADTIAAPATPQRSLSNHGLQQPPSLSRGISNKSAEEEAVESLMFLMSSPGNTAARREPRVGLHPGYQTQPPTFNQSSRRSSLLREESWSSTQSRPDADHDVTDAEEEEEEAEDDDEDTVRLRRLAAAAEGRNAQRQDKVPPKTDRPGNKSAYGSGYQSQRPLHDRLYKPGSGKDSAAGGVAGAGGAGRRGSGGYTEGVLTGTRRLAPGFAPS